MLGQFDLTNFKTYREHCNRLYNSSDYVYLIWELLYIIAVLTLMGINVNTVIPEINAVFY